MTAPFSSPACGQGWGGGSCSESVPGEAAPLTLPRKRGREKIAANDPRPSCRATRGRPPRASATGRWSAALWRRDSNSPVLNWRRTGGRRGDNALLLAALSGASAPHARRESRNRPSKPFLGTADRGWCRLMMQHGANALRCARPGSQPGVDAGPHSLDFRSARAGITV